MAKNASHNRTRVPKSMEQKPGQTAGAPDNLKPKRTILVVVLTAFVTTFTGSALNLSIPDLGQQFEVSAGIVGWLVTGYTLAVAAFSVPAGRIADLTCRKTVLAAGIALFTACCIGAVFSASMIMLILIRIAQGIGAAMVFSTNTAVLLSTFPAESRGRVIGYSLASTYAGLSSGPVLGGVLNQHFGWQAIFILTGVISAAALTAVFGLPAEREQGENNLGADSCEGGCRNEHCLEEDSCGRDCQEELKRDRLRWNAGSEDTRKAVSRFDKPGTGVQNVSVSKSVYNAAANSQQTAKIGSTQHQSQAPEQQSSKPRSLDLTGNILYLISIVLLMYGLSEIGKGWIPPVMAAAGLAFGIFFLRHELKTDDPAVDVRLFHQNIGYGFSNLSALLNYGATFAISYLVSIYLQVVQGFSSQATGLIMIAQPAIMAGLSPVAGRLSDKFSPFKLSSAGMGLCAAGTCMFIFLGPHTSLWLVITALAVTGLGFALFSSPNTNAVMSCVEEADYGVASSILATMRSIGHTLSMVVVTMIVTFYMQDTSLTDAPPEILIRVMRIAFIIFTGICIAGVFVSLKRR